MSSAWTRSGLTVLILMLGVSSFGCDRPSPLYVHSWTLQAEGVDAGHTVVLPEHVDDDLPDGGGYRLTTTVTIPEDWQDEELTLAIPFMWAIVDLSVDGVHINSSRSRVFERYRGYGVVSWDVGRFSQRQVELELSVENTWTPSGWLDTVPRIQPTERTDP